MKNSVKTTNKIIKFGRFRWVAATAILALIGSLCFISPPNNDEVFNKHFIAFEDNISDELNLLISTRGPNEDTPHAILLIKKAMNFYNQKAYNKAIPIFEEYLNNNSDANEFNQIELYLAVSLLGIGETSKSTFILEKLVASEKKTFRDDATWYLSLAYAHASKITAAKAQLKNLSNSKKYSSKVDKILDPTRSKDRITFK
ncbi:MAG: hypothetical protein MK207_01035 [Saprospiraceae bacterium]|nr:hypothetical protein [Saprospiraceae bacterium]